MKEKLELLCTKEFKYYEDMYKIIDYLNKNLANMDIVFGLTERENKHIISIYSERE